jgi:hypothetical protein
MTNSLEAHGGKTFETKRTPEIYRECREEVKVPGLLVVDGTRGNSPEVR